MEVEKIFHMAKGAGDNSYATNSLLQRTTITKARPALEESIKELYRDLLPECFTMADLGCSSGPNALVVVSEVVDIIDRARRSLNRRAPQLKFFLNDLPGNDFNNLFSLLPDFYKRVEEEKGCDFGPCFVSGTPSSFYGRIFPDRFLHFVHSSYSIHWLSQVPKGLMTEGVALNKGRILIARTSPPEVADAYYRQFERDFTLFLRSRASEMMHGGRMVLTFKRRIQGNDPDQSLELLGSTLLDMVLEGMIEEEKLDGFNLPYYPPTIEEVRQLVEAEGSFVVNKVETFTVDWSVDTTRNLDERANFVAKCIRAVTESLLTTAFGEATMDDLFLRYETRVKEHMMARQTSEHLNILVSMTKRG